MFISGWSIPLSFVLRMWNLWNIYLCHRQLVFSVCLRLGWQLIMSHSSAATLWDRELEEHETSIYFNLQLVHCAVSHSQDVGENIRNVWQPVKLPASVPSRQIWLCSSSALPELLPACQTVEEYWLCLSHLWMVKNKPDSTGTAAINVNRSGTNFICMEGCFVDLNL